MIEKRTWRKGKRLSVGWQVYICKGGVRFRKMFSERKEAEMLENNLKYNLMKGNMDLAKYKKKVSELAHEFIGYTMEELKAGRLEPSTVRQRKGSILNYVLCDRERYDGTPQEHLRDRMLPWSAEQGLGHLKMHAVHAGHIHSFFARLQLAGASYSLRVHVRNALWHMFEYGKMLGQWIMTNPVDGFKVTKTKAEYTPEIKLLAGGVVELLIAAADPMEELLVTFSTSTALRVGEVLALNWEQVDFNQKQLFVSATINELQKRVGTKTESGNRHVSISDRLLQMLGDHKAAASEIIEGVQMPPPGNAPVFLNKGRRYTHNTFYKNVLKPLREKAKLLKAQQPDRWPDLPSDLTWKAFRHLGISIWLDMKLSDLMVYKMAGHGSFVTIERTYGHVINSSEKQQLMNQAFDLTFGHVIQPRSKRDIQISGDFEVSAEEDKSIL